MNKVKILFVSADAFSYGSNSKLKLDEEAREIRQTVRASRHRDRIEVDFLWAVRTGDLLEALNEKRPQILHFSGHARDEGIMLVSDDGRRPHPVDADALAELIRAFRTNLRLVMLSACYSLAHAEALSSIVDCTIGIRALITDRSAIAFNTAFYTAVASGESVQGAFDYACTALKLKGFAKKEESPQLIVRPGVDPADVVLIPVRRSGSHDPLSPQLIVSPTVFDVPPVSRESDLVSVMMPFSRDFTATYHEIRKACDAAGLRCERADGVWDDSSVIQDVFNLIYRSAAVIVDLSGLNPNVMYECGIAHTLGRPVVPISRTTENLPFDLTHHRVLLYVPSKAGFTAMREALENRLRSLTSTVGQ